MRCRGLLQVEFSRSLAGSIDVVDTIHQSCLPDGIAPPTRGKQTKSKKRKSAGNKKTSEQLNLGLISDASEIKKLSIVNSLTVGQAVKVRVIACDKKKKHLRCSTVLSSTATSSLVPGSIVVCRIRDETRAPIDQALRVQMPGCRVGRVCVSDIRHRADWIDDQLGRLLEVAAQNDEGTNSANKRRPVHFVRARVISECKKADTKAGAFDLALWRPPTNADEEAIEHEIPQSTIQEGALLSGFVVNSSSSGVFVRVSRTLTARVFPRNLADGYVDNVEKQFPRGRLVVGRVLSVTEEGSNSKRNKKASTSRRLRVEMTLKSSAVTGTADESDDENVTVTWNDLKVGMRCNGRVKVVKDFGVFVRLDGSGSGFKRGAGIDGLAHITQCADGKKLQPGALSKMFDAGDFVRCKIIKVDIKRKRLSVTLKPSLVFAADDGADTAENDADSGKARDSSSSDDDSDGDSDDSEESADSDDSDSDDAAQPDTNPTKRSKNDQSKVIKAVAESNGDDDESSSDDDDSSEEEDSDDDSNVASSTKKEHDALFADMWGDEFSLATQRGRSDSDSEDSDSDSDSDDDTSTKAKSRAAQRKEAEAAVRRKELQLAAGGGEAQPESPEDYERLILGDPNSSFLWIRYITYYLALTEVDKARQIAERAITHINFRHEVDKLNVWGAYLNLEHRFGDEQTLAAVLRRALRQNDQRHVYSKMAEIYKRAGQIDDLVQLYQTTHKKFKEDLGFWEAHQVLLLQQQRPADAKRVLERALLSLPKFSHVQMITKFAQAEFVHGSVARARTFFDNLVDTHPKRLDLWNVYIDKEASGGHLVEARRLFERVVSMKWSSKKIRGLLKKWYLFEQKHGDSKSLRHVMDLAKRAVSDDIQNEDGTSDDDSDSENDDSDDDDDDDDSDDDVDDSDDDDSDDDDDDSDDSDSE